MELLRRERWGTNINFLVWLTVIVLLVVGMRWAMLRGTPPKADGWWWICSASLIAFLPNVLERLAYFRVIDLDGLLIGFFMIGLFSLMDIIGVSLYLPYAEFLRGKFPVAFHQIVMVSLLIFSFVVVMKIVRALA